MSFRVRDDLAVYELVIHYVLDMKRVFVIPLQLSERLTYRAMPSGILCLLARAPVA
jgi:hypothetical protein